MVVGGGIGGMQASLDLTASGFKVYLLDRNPAIGGVMAQLDKTFPTNDCAMCTLAPRLVDTGQHINIEKLTYSEVEKVTGSAGRFQVRVRKKARYVDTEKCTGCGECVQHCLVRNHAYLDGALELDLPTIDDDKKALVDRLVTEHPGGAEAVVPILQDINAELNWLPPEILLRLSELKEVSLERILRIATFYKSFSLTPRGKTIFTVCMGTACHVKGAPRIVDRLERELGIGAGETTSDMKFTIETVRCIGCCGLAPVMTTGEDLFGRLDPARLPKLLKKYNGASPS
jgi:NADH:ubiquinone oxidoreductase subunit E/NAD-dependent dihydropyrimidine dehydrogenase PreA subunit